MENELLGRWYGTSDNGFKLVITNELVYLWSNYGQEHPAFYDTLMSKEKYIGASNGTNITLTNSLTIIEYFPHKRKIAIMRNEDGRLIPISFIKRSE